MYQSMMHCKACDEILDAFDIMNEEDFNGLCERCYAEAMESVYTSYEEDKY